MTRRDTLTFGIVDIACAGGGSAKAALFNITGKIANKFRAAKINYNGSNLRSMRAPSRTARRRPALQRLPSPSAPA